MPITLDDLCGNWFNSDDYSTYTITKVEEQYLIHGVKNIAQQNAKSPFENIGVITENGNGKLKVVWKDTPRFSYASTTEQKTIVKIISKNELQHDSDILGTHPFYGNLKKIL